MSTRVKLNIAGFRALRNSPAVVAELERRAKAIAEAAGPGMETRPAETGGNRARVAVVTSSFEAMLAEAHHRTLTRAVGAGR